MKIEITKPVETTEVIEIELPYYFKWDLSDVSYTPVGYVIYGKIVENCQFLITHHLDDNKFVIEREDIKEYYCKPEYKSSNKEFEAARSKALELLEGM